MSPSVSSIFLTLLAAAAVQAVPQAAPSPSSSAAPGAYSPPPAPPAGPPGAPPPNPNAQLLKDLRLEATAIGRYQKLFVDPNGNLLQGQSLRDRSVFDFKAKSTVPPGARGGAVAAADVASFPLLTDLGIGVTVAFLGPCGMNTPHVHPRATEFLTVVEGQVQSGMILENGLLAPGKGSAEVVTLLDQWQGTVFPQGSIHYQFNTGCDPAVFVASLSDENPGTSQVAQNFFGLEGDVVEAAIGFTGPINGQQIDQFRTKIPANLALGVDACLQKCGLQRK